MQPRTNNFPYPTPAGSTQPVEDTSQPTAETEAATALNYPTGLTEAIIVAFCKSRNGVFQTWFEEFIKKIADLQRMFRNKNTGSKATKVTMPIATGIVESINARLQPALLSKPKIADAVPNFVSMDNNRPRMIEDFVNQTVLEKTRKPEKGKQAIKAAIIETMMIWRNTWKTETVRGTEPQYVPDPAYIVNPAMPEPPPMVYTGEQETEKEVSGWDWLLCNPANIAWDPHTTTRIQDSPWSRDKQDKSYNDLLRLQAEGMFQGVERLKIVVPEGAKGQMREGWEEQIRRASGDPNWNFTYADEKAYSVEEWWADMTWEDAGVTVQKKLRWFIVEGAYVVSIDENPLLPQRMPWGSCPLLIDPHSLTGISPLDPIKNIQEQINTMAGYQADLTERMAKPTVFYDSSSGISGRTNFMRMYGLQPVQNVQGIKEMTLDATPIKAVMEYLSFLIDLAQSSSGATEQFQGTEGADTLGEYEGLVQTAGSRFSDVTDTLSQGWLESLATECFLYTKQFGQDGQMFVRNGNQDGMVTALTRADFVGDYTFTAASSTSEQAKNGEIERVMKVLEVTSKMGPTPDGKVFDQQKAVRELLLPALNQKNGADWFVQLPPMPMPVAAPNGAPMPAQAPQEIPVSA